MCRRDAPVFGCGLDTFQLAFGRHRTAAYWHSEWDALPTKAHNELIHILATQGLCGAAALGVLTAGLLVATIRAWRRTRGSRRAVVLALAAGVAGFYVQDAFSFTVAGCGTLFVTFAALLSRLGRSEERAELSPRPGRAARIRGTNADVDGARLVAGRLLQVGTWAGAAALVVLGVWVPLRANRIAHVGDALLGEEPRQALACFRQAVAIDGGQDVYWVKLAGAAQAASQTVSSPSERHRLLREALQATERARDLVPVSAYHHANLGQLLAALAGEGAASADRVFAEFDTALARDPTNVYFYLDAGRCALALGKPARADGYALGGLRLFPEFAPFRAQRAYAAIARDRCDLALPLLCEALFQDWHGDLDGYRAAACTLAATLLRLDRLPEALAVARDVVAMTPEREEPRLILAQILEKLGRTDEAVAEYRRLLDTRAGQEPARQALARLGADDAAPNTSTH
jgi:tetratricopeptide (TPR) repeat protein